MTNAQRLELASAIGAVMSAEREKWAVWDRLSSERAWMEQKLHDVFGERSSKFHVEVNGRVVVVQYDVSEDRTARCTWEVIE